MEGSRSRDAAGFGFGRSSSSPSLLPQQQPPHPVPHKALWSQQQLPPRGRLRVWFIRVCTGVLVWTCLVQMFTVGQIWRRPHLPSVVGSFDPQRLFGELSELSGRLAQLSVENQAPPPAPPPVFLTKLNSMMGREVCNCSTATSVDGSSGNIHPPVGDEGCRRGIYKSNGILKVSCNGGLNQMRSAICDMVTIARFLNLTLVVPELDKKSFWADPSDFRDIFDVRHFIDSLRDEVHIIKRLPKKLIRKGANISITMPPVSWSNENYYLKQILPLFSKYKVIHFNKTDARLANNGLSVELQKLRCRINYHALKFTNQIETLGNKLVQILRAKGFFVALHLRYEMDMLAFSGCTYGCSSEEAELLKRMRYAYPWWREKEIVSEEKRLLGLCPLTPEETALVLQALGFGKETQIYIAAGEIFGSEGRLKALRTAFPRLVKKETLLDPADLKQFQNHSSQMAALDYMVSIASDIFIPTYDGNMAKVVEGHRRYLGFAKSILLDRRKLVWLLDLHQNKTLSWDEFANAVRMAHANRMGQPSLRRVTPEKPKEEDYFYANPQECLCNLHGCGHSNEGSVR